MELRCPYCLRWGDDSGTLNHASDCPWWLAWDAAYSLKRAARETGGRTPEGIVQAVLSLLDAIGPAETER